MTCYVTLCQPMCSFVLLCTPATLPRPPSVRYVVSFPYWVSFWCWFMRESLIPIKPRSQAPSLLAVHMLNGWMRDLETELCTFCEIECYFRWMKNALRMLPYWRQCFEQKNTILRLLTGHGWVSIQGILLCSKSIWFALKLLHTVWSWEVLPQHCLYLWPVM